MKMPEHKSERVQEGEKKASEKVTRKLSHGSPCLQQPYFITQHRSLGGNQAYLAILVLHSPQSNYYSPVFLLCFAMGKMNHSTYQLNACTSDWGGGNAGMYIQYVCVYASMGMHCCLCLCSRQAVACWSIVVTLFQSHQFSNISTLRCSRRSEWRYRDNYKDVTKNALLFAFILERAKLMWGQTRKVRVYDLWTVPLPAALIYRTDQPCQALRLIILSWLTINGNE